MEKAKESLEKEADLLELIRFMRVVRNYMQKKSPYQLQELEEKSKYSVIDVQSNSDEEVQTTVPENRVAPRSQRETMLENDDLELELRDID